MKWFFLKKRRKFDAVPALAGANKFSFMYRVIINHFVGFVLFIN